MRVLVSDLVVGTCDLTGKDNVECVTVILEDGTGEVACTPAEFIKLLRLRKKQESGDKHPDKIGSQAI